MKDEETRFLFILHPFFMSNNSHQPNWRGRFVRYAPLVLWIGLIMFLSTGQASMSNTSRFIRPLLEFIFPNASLETLEIYHAYIRKLAHVTVYAILAFWASRAFFSSSKNLLRRFWFVCAFVLVFLIASVDETNQSFINSRTGSIYDVLLDAFGGFLMITIFYLIVIYRNRRKF